MIIGLTVWMLHEFFFNLNLILSQLIALINKKCASK